MMGSAMKKNIVLLSALLPLTLVAPPMLLMRLQADPSRVAERITKKLSKPGKFGRYLSEGALRSDSAAGIFASYAGYLTVSPADGLISFPLKQSKPLFHLVVTRKVVPVVAFANTVDHLALDPAEPTELYLLSQQRDEMTGKSYWQVERDDLPEDNKLPLDAVILFAKPKNVIVPLGDMPTKLGQHFVLPDVFVRKGINILGRSLYVLSIAHFFKPVRLHAKLEPKRLIEQSTGDGA